MFESPSLIKRIAVGKLTGFILGLIGFMAVPLFAGLEDPMLQWGLLLWYTTVGAVVGVYGVFSRHPVLNLPMPWWFRAPIIGAWLNFVLTLFAYEKLATVLLAVFGEGGLFVSPFWFVLDGAIAGLVVGYFATKFGGEGENLPVS